jgi:uncharacterized membrane protein
MNTTAFCALAIAIGIIAGLRALTALMVARWAACFNWIDVSGTWAGFMGHKATAIIITVLAITELVTDQLPSTPSRKAPPSFAFRILCGVFSGAVLAVGSLQSSFLGVLCGGFGAIIGTLGGYDVRTGLVKRLRVPDFAIAIPEDLVAVGGGFLIMSLFPH